MDIHSKKELLKVAVGPSPIKKILKTVGVPIAAALGINPAAAPVVGAAGLMLAAPIAMAAAKGAAKPLGAAAGKGVVEVAKLPFKATAGGAKMLAKALKKKPQKQFPK